MILRLLLCPVACVAAASTSYAARLSADVVGVPSLRAKNQLADKVVKIEIQSRFGSDFASAVMLNDSIGITAASVFSQNADFIVDPDGQGIELAREDWKQYPGFRFSNSGGSNDLAMFRLAEPLAGAGHAKINRRAKERALIGEKATYVGFDVNASDYATDPILFRNRIDTVVDERDFHVLKIDLDETRLSGPQAPRTPTVSGAFDPMKAEGVIDRREWGGGLFVKNKRGKWRLAGIGSFGKNEYDHAYGGSLGVTAVGGFTNVASYKGWIDLYDEVSEWPSLQPAAIKSLTFDEVSESIVETVGAAATAETSTVPSPAAPAATVLTESVVALPEPTPVALVAWCFAASGAGLFRRGVAS